ncbi:hypothetical protein NXS19_004793 [Fusarium pseudograminearum]|nr:hypothetical protein NXS19_004793 [Fusarium pseudograminearum]
MFFFKNMAAPTCDHYNRHYVLAGRIVHAGVAGKDLYIPMATSSEDGCASLPPTFEQGPFSGPHLLLLHGGIFPPAN